MDHRTSAQYLVFSISGILYAINVSFVLKITELHQIARLPYMPEYILGLTNVSGGVQPVMDLRVLLGGKAAVSSCPQMALLLEIGESRICMVVDQVITMLEIEPAMVNAPLRKSRYVLGMAHVKQMDICLLAAEDLIQ